jgi:hypothetical protein
MAWCFFHRKAIRIKTHFNRIYTIIIWPPISPPTPHDVALCFSVVITRNVECQRSSKVKYFVMVKMRHNFSTSLVAAQASIGLKML